MKAAAELSTTYYGQLARDYLGLEPVSDAFHARPSAPKAVLDAVAANEQVRAMSLIAKTDERSLLVAFATAVAQNLDTTDERLALAQILWKLDAPHVALRVSRVAETRGDNFGRIAFPTTLLPDYKPLKPVSDKALIYGLIRQESEFNPRAQSWAGAGGLMQIMPGTAKMIARDYRLPYSQTRLIDDPAYNVRLGSAHIHDLVNNFNGSYIMALAGYNAGPGRSVQWMKRFGDPRTGAIDPIDWVELIPFTETRLYVQKVLQNVQVYRSMFAPGRPHVPLTEDLDRGADAESASVQNCRDHGRHTMAILIACATQ
jgi:soluble lytic murein transglycosylase